MGGGNISPQSHMWAQHCRVRDSAGLLFHPAGCGGQNEKWWQQLHLPAFSWSQICWVAHPIEKDAVNPEDQRLPRERNQGLGKFPRSRCPIWWAYFSCGFPRMAVGFVGTVVWKAVDSGKRDWVVETELEAPGCVLWGLLIPWGGSPHQAVSSMGQLVHPLLLVDPPDAVSGGYISPSLDISLEGFSP